MTALTLRYPTPAFVMVVMVLGARLVGADTPAERRAAVLALQGQSTAALPGLVRALDDENGVVRRTAARVLAKLGEPAHEALGAALGNSDFVVRLIALRTLTEALGNDVLPHLVKATTDESPVIRQIAAAALVEVHPRTDEVKKLIETASKDDADAVRQIAAKALWPFHKEVTSVRDRKDWDHDIKIAQSIPVPNDGWRLQFDPGRDAHLKKWYEPAFDDSKWYEVTVEKAWEEQGHVYDGVAWYRRSFTLPAKPEHLAVELRFGAVDECAWVWVNGKYVGQHDIGPEGWDQPFTLDVTKEIKWSAENQLTVRVFDSKFAGGIWKPVVVEVLK